MTEAQIDKLLEGLQTLVNLNINDTIDWSEFIGKTVVITGEGRYMIGTAAYEREERLVIEKVYTLSSKNKIKDYDYHIQVKSPNSLRLATPEDLENLKEARIRKKMHDYAKNYVDLKDKFGLSDEDIDLKLTQAILQL